MKTGNMTTTRSLTQVATILALAIGLMTTTAMAQSNGRPGLAPAGFYTGVESSAGTLEPTSGIRYGNTLVLNSFGEWETYHLTVSVDYSTNLFKPDCSIVTGGSWSLVAFREGAYFGTLYGKVSSGNVLISGNNNSDPSDPIQSTQVYLEATGGLGAFGGKKAIFLAGVQDTTTNLRTGEVEGRVEFNFSK